MPGASQMVLVLKNSPAKAGDAGDEVSIPRSRRSPGGGNGNPLQYSCLENPMDRGAWWATVHRIVKSLTQLNWLSTDACDLMAAKLMFWSPFFWHLFLDLSWLRSQKGEWGIYCPPSNQPSCQLGPGVFIHYLISHQNTLGATCV